MKPWNQIAAGTTPQMLVTGDQRVYEVHLFGGWYGDFEPRFIVYMLSPAQLTVDFF